MKKISEYSYIDDVMSIFEDIEFGNSRRMAECTSYVEKLIDREIKSSGEDAVNKRLEHRWDKICAAMTYDDFYNEEASGVYGPGYERLYRQILMAVLGFKFSVEQQSHIDPIDEGNEVKNAFLTFKDYMEIKLIELNRTVKTLRPHRS